MMNHRKPPAAEALGRMSARDFVAAWRSLVGEPPAVILEDRAEMIRILAEAVRAVPVCVEEPHGATIAIRP